MNEPNAIGPAQQEALSAFYGRALAQVRAGERAGKGRRHLVLFEPSVLWSAFGNGAAARLQARPRRGLRAARVQRRLRQRADRPLGVRRGPPRGARASAGRPCSPASGATDPAARATRRTLLPAPPGLPGLVPHERHALDLARELRRPAQGGRPARGPRAAGLGRVPGELRDQQGHAPAARADQPAHARLRAGGARAARRAPATARRHSERRGPRAPAARARSWPSCPLGRPTFSGERDQYLPANCLTVRAVPQHPHRGPQGPAPACAAPASRATSWRIRRAAAGALRVGSRR